MGRREGGPRGKEICTHTADSLRCTVETQHCKVIILQVKKNQPNKKTPKISCALLTLHWLQPRWVSTKKLPEIILVTLATLGSVSLHRHKVFSFKRRHAWPQFLASPGKKHEPCECASLHFSCTFVSRFGCDAPHSPPPPPLSWLECNCPERSYVRFPYSCNVV